MGTPASVLDFIARGGPASPEFQQGLQRVNANLPAVEAAQGQAQTGLAQAQAAETQQKTDLIQKQINDAEVIRQGYAQYAQDHDLGALDRHIAKNATGMGYIGWRQQDIDWRTKLQKLSDDQLTFNKRLWGEAAEVMQAAHDAPAGQQEAVYQQGLPKAQMNAKGSGVNIPLQYPGDDNALAIIGLLGHRTESLGQGKTSADIAQTQQATKTSAAQEAELKAKTPGTQALSDIDVLRAKAMTSGSAGDADKLFDQLFPIPDRRNLDYKSLYRNTMALGGPTEALKVLDKANEEAGTPAKAAATEKATAPLKTAQAVATEQATAPIKTQVAVNTARAIREADNPALAKVPPGLAQHTVTEATKLDTDYADAKRGMEDIGRVLDLADAGNKAAGANVPLMGVGAVNAVNSIKRINSAEIRQYGTAGSLFDRIQGKLQGWTEGKPIPTDVLNDMRELHDVLGQEAYKTYTTKLNSLNSRTGAAFQPTMEAPNIRGTKIPPGAIMGTSSTGRKGYSVDGGKTWVPLPAQ
jgi:hypothetical protein